MKILLADPTEAWCDALEAQLQGHYEVLRCCDGADVIPLLIEHRPELMVLGLELPNIDGLTLLRMIRTSGIQVKVLAAAYGYTNYSLDVLFEFDVSHIIYKPCSICAAMSQIYQLIHYKEGSDSAADPEPVLLALGLRMNLSGFHYLSAAIRMRREHPNVGVTKVIYPEVGKLYGVSGESVERAIRNVIQNAWKHRDERLWLAYFPKNRKGIIQPPRNGDFITRIAFCGNDNRACG